MSEHFSRRDFIKNVSAFTALGAGAAIFKPNIIQAKTNQNNSSLGFDFDPPFKSTNINSIRWDFPSRKYPKNIFKYGLAVATIDFETPEFIHQAITERMKHPSWGYLDAEVVYQSYKKEFITWEKQFKKNVILPEEVTLSDGVYTGIIAALRAFTPPGGKVLVMTPVYHGFFAMAKFANINWVESPMKIKKGRFEIDWKDLESKMTADVACMIVCNPHNPTGNVWKKNELIRMGKLAVKNKIVILSDEIFSDLVRPEYPFTPFSSLKNKDITNNLIVFGSNSKTFSIPGFKIAHYYSKNTVLLNRVNKFHRDNLNTLGLIASEVAYKKGGAWHLASLKYINKNHTILEEYVKKKMPMLGFIKSEGTFLNYLDFSKVIHKIGVKNLHKTYNHKTTGENFQDWLVYKSGVFLDNGERFGRGGEGFMRINIATSKHILLEALGSLKKAIDSI